MKVKKRTSVGQFAKVGEDFNDGDVLQILDEGQEIEGEYGTQTVFQVRLPNESSKNLSFNQTSLNKLIDAYGDDTEKWKGESVKVWAVNQMVSGKMRKVVYLTSPAQSLEE